MTSPSKNVRQRERPARAVPLLARFDSGLAKTETAAVILALAVMLISMGAVIVSRHSGGVGLGRYSDLGVGLIPWVGMLGAALALREGRHVGIAAVRKQLPAKGQAVLAKVATVVLVLFLVLVAWSGTELVMRQIDSGTTSPAMELPRWLVSLSVPVGAAFAAVHLLLGLTSRVTQRRSENDAIFTEAESELEPAATLPPRSEVD